MIRRSSTMSRGTTYWFRLFFYTRDTRIPNISFTHVQVFRTQVLTIVKKNDAIKGMKDTTNSIPGSTLLSTGHRDEGREYPGGGGGGLFLESPGNFSSLKSQLKNCHTH